MMNVYRPLTGLRLLAGFAALVLSQVISAQPTQKIAYDIPAQSLESALTQFGVQSKRQLVFDPDTVPARTTPAVKGEYTPLEALDILIGNSGLTYTVDGKDTIIVRRITAASSGVDSSLRLAQSETQEMKKVESAENQNPENETTPSKDSAESLENKEQEIVVTGTSIAGAAPVGSPVLTFTRIDIERTGAATAQQFLATLPQNFGGGATEDTNSGGQIPGQFSNDVYGSAVNLRGLGSNGTLVLINGRRQASAGRAEYVDVAMIPLSAVERIEVLLDGASAIYGSDAIGGVVNFIMRDSYRGAETRLRAGTTTRGGGELTQVAQSFGIGWDSGNALLTYEYLRQDPISALERDFSKGESTAGGSRNLVVGQKRHSAFLSGRQQLSSPISLSANASFSERDAEDALFDPRRSAFSHYASTSRQTGAGLTLNVDPGARWAAEVAAGMSEARLGSRGDLSSGGVSLTRSTYEVRSADAKVTGDLLGVPAGQVKIALGVAYREELYDLTLTSFPSNIITTVPDREMRVSAAYSEIMIPILPAASGGSAVPRVAISAAARYEDYNKFGDTFDPKFGIRWVVLEGVELGGSYGTSFKAPTLSQTYEGGALAGFLLFNWPDAQFPGGTRRIAVRTGNNDELQPETAKIWTATLKLSPERFRGFSAQVSWFDIRYRDRIAAVAFNPTLALYDAGFAPIRLKRGEVSDAQFNARMAEILSLMDTATVSNCQPPAGTGPCTEPVSNFSAILDFGLRNLSLSRNGGIDVLMSQTLESGAGSFEFAFNGTRLVKTDRQLTTDALTTDMLDTIYNPVKLRLRTTASWTFGRMGATAAVNYTNSYQNNSVAPVEPITSWATVDLNVRYRFPVLEASWQRGLGLSLSATNLFDRDPPFARQFTALGYDPANADPYGRQLSLSISKSW